MTDSVTFPSSILIDVELPDPAPLPPVLLELLASLRIVLVGWYAVPEQTSPAQARDQFGAEAEAALAQMAQEFEARGATVETHLVFTADEMDTISRISSEEDCDAVLIPAAIEDLHRLLVPIRGLHNAQRIAPVVADLVRDGTTNVTVVHILEEDETEESARATVLKPMADRMTERGIDAGIVQLETLAADDPGDTIVRLAANYDTVVIGETKPSVREILFGGVSEQIAQSTEVPVIVVRHLDDRVDVAERATKETR